MIDLCLPDLLFITLFCFILMLLLLRCCTTNRLCALVCCFGQHVHFLLAVCCAVLCKLSIDICFANTLGNICIKSDVLSPAY